MSITFSKTIILFDPKENDEKDVTRDSLLPHKKAFLKAGVFGNDFWRYNRDELIVKKNSVPDLA